ncbi:MAG: S41 family peptidase [Mizugakiibacter sp.]|uniref:S41 family peptidase n=1 Tax=Mizugakiibacter sp. TaxID=1972610 RepID=UPI0031C92261|nr:S41 family peptidase [Xanthomonadaceae bacterium]
MRISPLLLALLLAVPAARAAGPDAAPAPADAKPAAAAPTQPDLDDIRNFTHIYELVKQAYVDPVDDKTLMQAAIHGMLAGLDPHSEYLDTAGLQALTEDTTGAYGGLGIEVLQVNGELRVIAPIDDTPAQRAGIKAGDVITRVNGKPVDPDALDEAVKQLRGEPGTKIALTILHENAAKPVDMTLTRERIVVTSVKARLLEPGYAYIRISQFQDDTTDDLRRKLEALVKKSGPLRGAVLDLRSNPGGLLTAAVGVSDAFLDSGVIVTTKGRLKQADLSFSATPGDLLNGAPLVVLVDNGTASAAEIVAGALKDDHRALIMGRRTFGKGSVQTVLPLDDNRAVKLTTARYYTPSGTSIQAAGIAPDIALADLAVSHRNEAPQLIGSERDLPNHLKGDHEGDGHHDGDGAALALQDYALSEALHVLKGMALGKPAAAAPDAH